MPIYEYECDNCGTRFERFQSIQDEPIRQCPDCLGQVHKVFHPAGIIFKGSGWYITDSRKATSSAVTGDAKSNGTESKTASKPNGGTSKAETKPATTEAKVEAKPSSKAEAK